MAKNVIWTGDQYVRKVQRHEERQLYRAALELVQRIKDSFGDSGITGQKSGATRQQRASNRSKAWGPPHVDAGFLKSSLGSERSAGRSLSHKVGTGIGGRKGTGYALFLEFGTRFMLPRPFMRPGLFKFKPRFMQIMTAPIR